MPSLDSQPDNYLLDKINELDRQVTNLASIRKRPAVNLFAAKTGNQVIAATTYTKITGWSIFYTNPLDSWDAATSVYTPAAAGMYQVTAQLVWTGGTASQKTVVFFSEAPSSFLAGSGWVTLGADDLTTPVSCITQMDANVGYYLSVYRYVAGGTVQGTASTLQIHRLSDVPANS